MMMRHRSQDRLRKHRAQYLHLLLMAWRAEPATFAGERQQVFMAALVAAHARETFGEAAALHELVDHFRDHPAQHAVARLILAWVRGCEVIKVRVQALPQRDAVIRPCKAASSDRSKRRTAAPRHKSQTFVAGAGADLPLSEVEAPCVRCCRFVP